MKEMTDLDILWAGRFSDCTDEQKAYKRAIKKVSREIMPEPRPSIFHNLPTLAGFRAQWTGFKRELDALSPELRLAGDAVAELIRK